ncbi:39S ribosomal protein L38_ mitochondrial, partial [Caligus rogercresseyi]
MFSAVWRRSYHWKDLRPHGRQREWFNNNGLSKSGYPNSNPKREPGVDLDLQERIHELKGSKLAALGKRLDIGHPPFKSE